MRIGFNCRFAHAAHVTGVERYAWNLLESIVKEGKEEEFLLLGCGETPTPADGLPNISRIGSCLHSSSAKRQFWEQVTLPRLATRSKADILINPINTAPLLFGRNIVVVHDLAFLEHPEWFSSSFGRFYRSIVPRAARKALAVVTVSEYSKSRIVRTLGVPCEKVHVIYQGVDPTFHPTDDKRINRVKAKYGLQERYLLSVGSFSPRKNLQRTVEAFTKAREQLNLPITLAVAGVKSFQFRDTDEAIEKDGVKALGYTSDDDLPALYSGATGLVYPSLYEGFGLPPLEAMACGSPTIVSNTTSLPEVVGDAALAIDPENVPEITDAIVRLLCDESLQQELSHRGIERASRFNWQSTARQMLELTRNLQK